MRKKSVILSLLIIAALLLAAAPARAGEQWHYDEDFAEEGLGGTIERYLSEKGISSRSITIGWQDVESGEEWYLGADVFMEGASTYKLPLCMLYADWVADGSVTREDKLGAYTVDLAVREALVNSSNNAADALRNGVSGDHGKYRTAIAVNCGLDPEDLPSGYYTANQFSPRYLIGTLRTLWDNSEKYDWVLNYMKQAQPAGCFSRYRGSYEVAHKTGNALGYICDTGIIYTSRPFLLTVMSSGVPDADRVLGEIARIAMDYAEYLDGKDASPPTPEPIPVPTPVPTTVNPKLPEAGADGVREISDAAELSGIALAPEDRYRLAKDIDLSGVDWKPISFFGTLDGAGHTIYNLSLRAPGEETVECRDGNNLPYDAHYVGLFSVVKNATVRDLQLRGVLAEVESEDNCFIAALAGYAYDLTAENVSVEGRLRLYAHGKIVGVGGMIGFGSGWFSDCSSDVELVFEDRNTDLHCEQFLGGLAASGKFTAERCSISIRGYASVIGFVHTGGMVGMYCGYGLVRDRMMTVTDCTVKGKISFFENNFTRRAYCRGFAGEQVDLVINERNDISGFKRDEHFSYDVILSPETCAEPRYAATITAPDCTHWGYTEHLCQGCGYSWVDSYTPPRHTPGEKETLREPDYGAEGEAVIRCAVCGELIESETLPAMTDPKAISIYPETLSLQRGESRSLTVFFLPEGAERRPLIWISSDDSVALVDENGTVTGVDGGEAVIRCTTEDGALSSECKVEIPLGWFRRLFNWFQFR